MCSLAHAKLWPTLPVLELHVVYSTADLATSSHIFVHYVLVCMCVCMFVCALRLTHFTHRETSQCDEENYLSGQ